MKRKGKKLKGAACGPVVLRRVVCEVVLSEGRSEYALRVSYGSLQRGCWLTCERVVPNTDESLWRVSITVRA